ncbi:uncharacterized protein TNCV_1421201 [Trichonephila clavipes]|nr:uncharacterized protein TNCV_1421201 [Trichonephila clavipes]
MLYNYGYFLNWKKSESDKFTWQQDGAPPHWLISVHDWLNITVPNQRIGRKGHHDKACFAWSPRSPDLKPCDFYLWYFIKDFMYVPPLTADFPD